MKLSTRLLLIIIFCAAFTKAQVGIGTNDPKAALDIRATANPEESGLLIPKLATFPPGMTNDQDGMLVYIDGSGATSKGFYYYEAVTDTWIPIAGAAAVDNQQIDVLNLNGTDLEISLQDDGQATQTLDLSPLQDGIGTDNQQIDVLNLNGTDLEISLQDDGVTTQTVNLASLQDGRSGTLDEAYDYGGAGNGRIINATNGDVEINGNNGLEINTTGGSGIRVIQNTTGTGQSGITVLSDITSTSSSSINYGLQLNSSGGGTGSYYGVRNLTNGLSSHDRIIGSYNGLSNNGVNSSSAIGTYNAIATRSTLRVGTENNITLGNTITTDYGIRNNINTSSGTIYGIYNNITGFNNGLKYGEYTLINSVASGTHYGNYIDVRKANSYAAYFIGRTSLGNFTTNRYLMPANDGNPGQVMTTDGSGNVTFQTPAIDTDNQQIDVLNLNGTNLEISLQDDGVATQTVNLSSLQDGTGTDNQTIDNLSLSGSTLRLSLEDDGQALQTVDLSSIDTDNQQIDVLNLNGTNLEISLQDDGVATQTLNLASLQESTTANNGLSLNTGTVQLGGVLTQNTAITQGTNNFDINLNSTGDFAIQDNGSDVFFVEDSGEIGIGTNVPVYPLHMVETGPYNNGFFMTKIETSSSETSGIRIEKQSLGTGRSHGLYTVISGSGTGQKYGVFNRLSATSNGSQYGTRNFHSGATASSQFATFNNLDNNGTGNRYGVYNGMRGANAANLYGVYNEFERAYTSATDIVGVRNRFTGGTPGAAGMNGVWTDFTTAANGNYYGTRTEFSNIATGTGNKYGNYNLISSTAGGTHYGTFNNVSTTNGWAGYFIGRNYISRRLSIGEEDNANARLNVSLNSSSTIIQAELEETGANDGARLKFTNSVETDNDWTLYGRADNTVADSQFNIFHTGTGNVISASGNGNVGITGNADTDFHVFHGNSGTTSGMKLENTTDNSWWRFYVSSGSDDLRLYSTSQGTTIIGAFNDITGAYTATSDRRLKKDFKELHFSWDKFLKLEPLTYTYKSDQENIRTIGMVAQDVEQIYPELVNYHEDQDIYHMDYSATGVVAIKAIQEQQKTIAQLQKEIEKLKIENERLSSLEKRIEALEKK